MFFFLPKIMRVWIPEFVKKRKLNELFHLTAEAFQSEPPELGGLSFAECLREYALFTKEQAETYLQKGYSLEKIRRRLYQKSELFGERMRKSLHIIKWTEAVAVLEIIYKLIGIDLHYKRGEISITYCYFSKYYSGEVCRLISALDQGLAAGLTGGGELCFIQRITEGASCCKGYFQEEVCHEKGDCGR